MFFRLLLMVLLIPSLAAGYTVVRKDGKKFQGELLKQTADETTIKDKDGVTLKFKSDQIDWTKTTREIRAAEKDAESEKKDQPSKGTFATKELRDDTARWTGEPISVDFKEIDMRDFFRFIADISQMNIIIDPAVKGTLTLKMRDVPWDQVLDLVCRTYGYGYEVSGNVIDVDR